MSNPGHVCTIKQKVGQACPPIKISIKSQFLRSKARGLYKKSFVQICYYYAYQIFNLIILIIFLIKELIGLILKIGF
jgi:hypothetical protein